MNKLVGVLLGAALLLIGYALWPTAKRVFRAAPAMDAQSQRALQIFAKDNRVQDDKQAYSRRVQSTQVAAQLSEVTYFCLDKYHRDTCLHTLISCGERCVALLPKDKYARIFNDYWTLMKQRGLVQ